MNTDFRSATARRRAAWLALVAVGVMLVSGCGGPAVGVATGGGPAAYPTLDAAVDAVIATGVAATLQASPIATPITTPALDAPQIACRLWLKATMDVPFREGPGTDYPSMGQMDAGQDAEVLSHDGSFRWLLVPLIDGRKAWVPMAAVQLSDCNNFPYIESLLPAE